MNWLPWVIEGARIWNDVNAAEDRVKVEEQHQDAQIAANRAQAVLADNNAQLAEWQAADALYRGGRELKNVNIQTRLLKGRQVVAAAASGAAIGSGSVVNLLTDTDMFGFEEGVTVQHNAEREAWAYRMQALDSRNRAEILRHSKVPVASDAGTAITASLINSAARIYDRSQRG